MNFASECLGNSKNLWAHVLRIFSLNILLDTLTWWAAMYLRATKRKNKNGTVTEYLQLAHNERDPETNTTVARIIHSFGRADQLDRDDLVRLTRSIARVCGVTILDPSEQAKSSAGLLPDDVKILRTVELGTVLVIEALWERLGIGKTLRALLGKGTVAYDQALLAMTANRLCEPESKLGVWDRWLEKVYLPRSSDLKLRQMYEAMDFLHTNIAAVEETVFFQTADLFNLSVDLIFYDTTTASFSIDYEDESDENTTGLRQYGHAKEGFWSPQIVVALAVTREGLPVKSWVETSAMEKPGLRAIRQGTQLPLPINVLDLGQAAVIPSYRLEIRLLQGRKIQPVHGKGNELAAGADPL